MWIPKRLVAARGPPAGAEIGWPAAAVRPICPLRHHVRRHGGIAMHFRIRGLPAEKFAPLFALSDAELAAVRCGGSRTAASPDIRAASALPIRSRATS